MDTLAWEVENRTEDCMVTGGHRCNSAITG
jgi:hypothetical protein